MTSTKLLSIAVLALSSSLAMAQPTTPPSPSGTSDNTPKGPNDCPTGTVPRADMKDPAMKAEKSVRSPKGVECVSVGSMKK
jgi:hypothetical protein